MYILLFDYFVRIFSPSNPSAAQKKSLLQAVSGTNNGESATPDRQAAVLQLV
jgi:hypothetical protein